MAGPRRSDAKPTRRNRAPARTPEAQESRLISLAYDLVEKKLEDGTASSQETTHFLKLGSSREMLEQERIAMAIEYDKAKIDTMASAQRVEELMEVAINAFQAYSGNGGPAALEDFNDDYGDSYED